ncbi:hypothetical protein [Runella sp.]|uniref:hypothetical protein n=1 Tax=Runella sp. TaxID=1960881 RepID=UPI003D15054C
MKIVQYFLLFLVTVSCREKTPTPPETLAPLVGKWRLDAYERTENGKKVWKAVDPQSTSFLSFRFDGVVLDSKGLPSCCAPGSLTINGKEFKIIPQAALPENPSCAYIDCISCATMDIELTGDTFIQHSCFGSRSRYVRDNQ